MVGRYLVAAELASDPEQAYRYAQAARHYAARIGVVRELSGITAYKTERWTEALAELRAARRLTGRNDYLALMADAERGLGRLDRALEVVHSPEAKRLPRAAQIELRIVESGIRRDQGLADAAVLALQVPELTDGKLRPWSARLFYAYGDALLAAGRREAAREAFARAVVADEDEQTDALARLDELDGVTVADLEDDEDDELDAASSSDADLDDEEDDDEDDDDDDDRRRRPTTTTTTTPTSTTRTTSDDDDEDDDDGRRRSSRSGRRRGRARRRGRGAAGDRAEAEDPPRSSQRDGPDGRPSREPRRDPASRRGAQPVRPDGDEPRAGPARLRRGCSSLSSQCQIPPTFAAAPDSRSNFSATSGSASGASDRYRDIVRWRTASTAWSRSIPALRAARVASTQTEISSADRSSVDATDVTGP